MKQMNLISGHNRDKLKKESAQDILTLQPTAWTSGSAATTGRTTFDLEESPSL